mmetsp:Transcript_670/g.840  ORF Transcript_670/g.840 Transcript_670/m.840 type:complete len:147 (+) Transcript_670:198-638(+)|eukprot:CAMPEP_0178908880 /NCGR_PEP_ID=MMETSP0786-20121207/8170_1 /TAXON_ID=186022 /ORGANISM="Thalassionema frauenfeldii, Strain CCMP 1798" /LENGTH=146 /DNA_ID=CAMNT_0020580835 /DNA_START=414 /DNA_END=854 /DNA_ORIENTATION=-
MSSEDGEDKKLHVVAKPLAKRKRSDSSENSSPETSSDRNIGESSQKGSKRIRQHRGDYEKHRRQKQKDAWNDLMNTVIDINASLPVESQLALTRKITAENAKIKSTNSMVVSQIDLVQNSIDLIDKLSAENEKLDKKIVLTAVLET